MKLGRKCLVHVSQTLTEEARLLEIRNDGLDAFVEWRGVFCEISMRRVVLNHRMNSISSL